MDLIDRLTEKARELRQYGTSGAFVPGAIADLMDEAAKALEGTEIKPAPRPFKGLQADQPFVLDEDGHYVVIDGDWYWKTSKDGKWWEPVELTTA